MAETKSVAKVKKRWYTVLAPETFNKKEITDVSAVSAEATVGKIIDITGQMLTGITKDMSRKYKLRLTEAVGDKINTKALAYYLAESYVQRTARRYKERFIYVIKAPTKDNVTVKIKLFFLDLKKLHHSERGALIAKTKELMAIEVKALDAAALFDPNIIEKLANDLRKNTAEIYEVDKILLTKLSIIG
jgi:small subunit ribosomal protein S3Ae